MTAPARVLIVDDEESIRGLLHETLVLHGVEVIEAGSGEEALKELNAHAFDLVISDIRMPGLTGIELLQRIKTLGLDPEVIIMTSNASLETALEAIRLGAYDYLLKPFEDLDLVGAVVKRAIERRRLARDNQRLVLELKQNNDALQKATQRAAQILAESHASRGQVERLLQAESAADAAARVVEGAGRLLHARAAALWMFDGAAGALRPLAAMGLERASLPQLPPAQADTTAPTPVDLERWLDSIRPHWAGRALSARPLAVGPRTYGLLAWEGAEATGAQDSAWLEHFHAVAAAVLRRFLEPAGTPTGNGQKPAAVEAGGLRITDGLTPLLGFDLFLDLLGFEISRSRRYHHRFTLMLISVRIEGVEADRERQVMLRDLVLQLRGRIRSTDFATRQGLNFFLLLPETALDDARAMERALQQLFDAFAAEHAGAAGRAPMVWSLTLAEYPKDGDTAEGLLVQIETRAAAAGRG